MIKVLLISSSYLYGSGYLDHCAGEIHDFLRNLKRVLFVPYGLRQWSEYSLKTRERFLRIGYEIDSIHEAVEPREAIGQAQAIFVGGGNTFRLLRALCDHGLLQSIRSRVLEGVPYVGASAGANIACPTIKTTNDMPIVCPPSLEALNLAPFQINPHYLDPDPKSTHMGETREARIREFHEENDLPVIGLREGSLLRIEGKSLYVKGQSGVRLFLKGEDPQEFAPGTRMDFLVDQAPEATAWTWH